ncbi:MAG TPA: hypothetical protein VKX16_09340 [Chloroflexota bacterium]|nr:hypothetical protein [Chloroflexota bacterium]
MMSYTVQGMPKALKRLTTYTLYNQSRAVLVEQYPGIQPANSLGTFIRYVQYTLPHNWPSGTYTFVGTLQIGSVMARREWTFAIPRVASVSP